MSREDHGPVRRRSGHVEMPVAYGAVGATQDPDLLRFPPVGFTPYEETLRLGSGEARFTLASSHLMTWGAHRAAGAEVTDVVRGTDEEYSGIGYDASGQAQATGEREDVFGPDGTPYLNAGTEATLRAHGLEARRVLVVYTVNEERTVGFAWGTSDERGPVGEQRFIVEWRDDGTVWAVARGFLAAPKSGLLGIKARSDLRSAVDAVKKQLEALAPGAAPTGAPPVDPVETADPEPKA